MELCNVYFSNTEMPINPTHPRLKAARGDGETVLRWVLHRNEEKWMRSGARKRVLEQAVGASRAPGDWLMESVFRRQAASARRQVEKPSPPTWLRPLQARFSPSRPPAARSPSRPWIRTKDPLVPWPLALDFLPQPTT